MEMSSSWRNQILERLRTRNRTQSEPFQELILLHAKVLERALHLQQENDRLLTFQIQNRRGEGGGGAAAADDHGASSSTSGSSQLEEMKAKVYGLQEELTALHRRKGENAQQVIDLSAQAKSQEAELNDQAQKLLQQEDLIDQLKANVER